VGASLHPRNSYAGSEDVSFGIEGDAVTIVDDADRKSVPVNGNADFDSAGAGMTVHIRHGFLDNTKC
jgi:hypothetical protein